jgi:hypothetical protein
VADTYIKLDDGLPEHRKIVAVGTEGGWLYVCALAYSSRNKTDGRIPKGVVPRLADIRRTSVVVGKLLANDLWHTHGHGCTTCAQPGPDEYQIHNYLKRQRSASEIEEIREKRAAAGAVGGAKRAANAKQKPKQSAKQSASPLLGLGLNSAEAKANPESESDTELNRELRSLPDAARSGRHAVALSDADSETDNQRANRLAKIYTDLVPLSRFPAIAGIVRKAIQADKTDAEIGDALTRLAKEGRSLTVDVLRVEIEGLPVPSPRLYGSRPATNDVKAAQADAALAELLAEKAAKTTGQPPQHIQWDTA